MKRLQRERERDWANLVKLIEYIFKPDLDSIFYDQSSRTSIKNILATSFWLMPSTPKFVPEGIKYITSQNIKNNRIDFSNVKFIDKNTYNSFSRNRQLKINDILVTMIGTIGQIARINEEPDFYGQNIYVLRLDKNKIDSDYFMHYFNNVKIQNKLKESLLLSSQGYLRAENILDLEIYLPNIQFQRKISEYLRIFEEITNSLTTGLPKEIELREQQYAYYRDKLLSFAQETLEVSPERERERACARVK